MPRLWTSLPRPEDLLDQKKWRMISSPSSSDSEVDKPLKPAPARPAILDLTTPSVNGGRSPILDTSSSEDESKKMEMERKKKEKKTKMYSEDRKKVKEEKKEKRKEKEPKSNDTPPTPSKAASSCSGTKVVDLFEGMEASGNAKRERRLKTWPDDPNRISVVGWSNERILTHFNAFAHSYVAPLPKEQVERILRGEDSGNDGEAEPTRKNEKDRDRERGRERERRRERKKMKKDYEDDEDWEPVYRDRFRSMEKGTCRRQTRSMSRGRRRRDESDGDERMDGSSSGGEDRKEGKDGLKNRKRRSAKGEEANRAAGGSEAREEESVMDVLELNGEGHDGEAELKRKKEKDRDRERDRERRREREKKRDETVYNGDGSPVRASFDSDAEESDIVLSKPDEKEKEGPVQETRQCTECSQTFSLDTAIAPSSVWCSKECIEARAARALESIDNHDSKVAMIRPDGHMITEGPTVSTLGEFLLRFPECVPMLPEKAPAPKAPRSAANPPKDNSMSSHTMRVEVKRAIRVALYTRMKTTIGRTFRKSECKEMAKRLENELFIANGQNAFNEEYKFWFGSFVKCVKSPMNKGFFHRVLAGLISPQRAVTLDEKAMMSEEYAAAVPQLAAAASSNAPAAATPRGGDDVSLEGIQPTSALDSILADGNRNTTSQHNSHFYDANRDICAKKTKWEPPRDERSPELLQQQPPLLAPPPVAPNLAYGAAAEEDADGAGATESDLLLPPMFFELRAKAAENDPEDEGAELEIRTMSDLVSAINVSSERSRVNLMQCIKAMNEMTPIARNAVLEKIKTERMKEEAEEEEQRNNHETPTTDEGSTGVIRSVIEADDNTVDSSECREGDVLLEDPSMDALEERREEDQMEDVEELEDEDEEEEEMEDEEELTEITYVSSEEGEGVDDQDHFIYSSNDEGGKESEGEEYRHDGEEQPPFNEDNHDGEEVVLMAEEEEIQTAYFEEEVEVDEGNDYYGGRRMEEAMEVEGEEEESSEGSARPVTYRMSDSESSDGGCSPPRHFASVAAARGRGGRLMIGQSVQRAAAVTAANPRGGPPTPMMDRMQGQQGQQGGPAPMRRHQ